MAEKDPPPSDNPLLNPGAAKPAVPISAAPPPPLPGVPADIPDLKKKEEEKKKAGAAGSWGGSQQAFQGARGGSGIAQSAAARTAASAARSVMMSSGQPGWLTALARMLGVNSRLLSLALGRGLMAAALVGAVAAGGVFAGHSPQAKVAKIAMGELGREIKSQVSKNVGSSLPASLGSFRDYFGSGGKPAPSGGLTAPSQTAQAESPLPAPESSLPLNEAAGPAELDAAPERRAGMLGKSGLGVGGQLARSGAMQLGKTGVYDRGKLLDLSKGDVAQGKFQGYYNADAKQGKAMKSKGGKYVHGKGGGRAHVKAFNSRALAQLRTMGTRTGAVTAAGTSLENASSAAMQQFENSGEGGQAPPGPEGETAPPANPSTGNNAGPGPTPTAPPIECPDMTTPDGNGGCKPNVDDKNATPWQKELDAANGLILAASIVMIAAGIASQIKPYGYIVSIVLGAIAIALCVAAIVLGAIIISKGGDMQGGLTIAVGGLCIIEAALAMAGKLSTGMMVLLPMVAMLYAIINMSVSSSGGGYSPG
jgi:hypothetical protein